MLCKNAVNKKCIFCTREAKKKDAKMYLMLPAFAVPLHFAGAEHFPLENVQHQQNVRAAQKTPNTAALNPFLFLPVFSHSVR